MCLFHCVVATEFDYRVQYNRFRVVLHAVDSLNVKLTWNAEVSKRCRAFCPRISKVLLKESKLVIWRTFLSIKWLIIDRLRPQGFSLKKLEGREMKKMPLQFFNGKAQGKSNHIGRCRRRSRILKWGVNLCNNVIEPKPG